MKIILGCLCVVIVLTISCTGEKVWQINGSWDDGNGKVVYLQKVLDDNKYETIDSVVVQEGKFSFSGPLVIDRRQVFSKAGKIEVMLEEEPVNVSFVKKTSGEGDSQSTYQDVEASGSQEQVVLQRGNNLSTLKSLFQLGSMFAMVKVKDDPVKLDSTMKELEMMNKEMDKSLKNLLDSNTNCYASAFVIGGFVLPKYSYDEAKGYYERLTERVKTSNPGQWLKEKMAAASQVNIGGIAPEIDLLSPDSIGVKLSSLRGKYVLLDFWASWCGPCLAEMPNVKEIYEEYHDRGLEIYGVSLDEKTDLWQNAIKSNALPWIHVSSLKGWKCPMAKRYGVTGIPKMYLLDKEGHIIAMDLRGEALKKKIDSLFN